MQCCFPSLKSHYKNTPSCRSNHAPTIQCHSWWWKPVRGSGLFVVSICNSLINCFVSETHRHHSKCSTRSFRTGDTLGLWNTRLYALQYSRTTRDATSTCGACKHNSWDRELNFISFTLYLSDYIRLATSYCGIRDTTEETLLCKFR